MRERNTFGLWCLETAFGFLPGLKVGPYGGRGISRAVPTAFVSATGEIMREHALWRRYGLGATEVHELPDVYTGIMSGKHADRIRRHVLRGGGRLQFFYMAPREEEVLQELGLSTHDTYNATARATARVGSKIELHRSARRMRSPHLVVPARVCTDARGLVQAHHELMRENHNIRLPDFSVLKHEAWASGVGTLLTADPTEIMKYGNENCDGKTEILIEAGYSGIRDVAVQATLTNLGVVELYLNEQVIRNGKDHAGNLVVTGDALPVLSNEDRTCLYRRGMVLMQLWWQMGYRGEIGVDAIGIDGRNVDYTDSDLTAIEREAMQAGRMLDWRFIDPNARTTASQYPRSVLRQLEHMHGGHWAVLMCNVWPSPGAVENHRDLSRILRDLLPDGDSGVLPLMTSLLPGKFAVVCMARESSSQSAAARANALLAKVRHRVGST